MTYKNAVDNFKIKYDLHGGTRNLSDKVILMLLSEVYAELANKYRLVKKTKVLRLTEAQSAYTKGTGSGEIPTDYLSIDTVKFAQGTTNEKTLDYVPYSVIAGDLSSGKPTKYALWLNNGSETLYLNSEPDQTFTSSNGYSLTMYYLAKIYAYSGTAENSFADLDFTSTSFGGSFLTPTEWDSAIINGAVANIIKDNFLMEKYLMEVKDLEQRKPGAGLSISYYGGV